MSLKKREMSTCMSPPVILTLKVLYLKARTVSDKWTPLMHMQCVAFAGKQIEKFRIVFPPILSLHLRVIAGKFIKVVCLM